MDVRENLGMKFELIKAKVGGKKKNESHLLPLLSGLQQGLIFPLSLKRLKRKTTETLIIKIKYNKNTHTLW